jgi:hypothetical protein
VKFHQVVSDLTKAISPKQPKKKNKKKAKKQKQEGKKDDIWELGDDSERLRIREFWINLGPEGRKSLTKLDKFVVLKKMKEQQKQSCSCTVCGRRR